MIEMKGVVSGYGQSTVLHGVDFRAERGKITTLIGENGCGKSTLLKTLLGFVPVRDGQIRLDGEDLVTLSSAELARRIAYLPQGKNVPDITVGRMVLHGRFPYLSYPRRYRKRDFEIASRVMRETGIAELAERPVASLSGGMRQKVYIAMALAQEAPVIVMDEPTTYLDIGQQMKFASSVRALSQSGKTVVLVLHDILMALKISDSIAVMRQGRVIADGAPREIQRSGVLREIYGVDVRAVQTEDGLQYYYAAY